MILTIDPSEYYFTNISMFILQTELLKQVSHQFLDPKASIIKIPIKTTKSKVKKKKL